MNKKYINGDAVSDSFKICVELVRVVGEGKPGNSPLTGSDLPSHW